MQNPDPPLIRSAERETSSVTAASDEFTASSSLDLDSTGASTSTTATNRSRGALNERPALAEMDSERATLTAADNRWLPAQAPSPPATGVLRSIHPPSFTSVKSTPNHTTFPTPTLPKIVKPMTGVPWGWECHLVGKSPFPHGDIFGSPPQPRCPRKQRVNDRGNRKIPNWTQSTSVPPDIKLLSIASP
ncbi:hypothetical protein JOM56_002101 [Amanita muscaria]